MPRCVRGRGANTLSGRWNKERGPQVDGWEEKWKGRWREGEGREESQGWWYFELHPTPDSVWPTKLHVHPLNEAVHVPRTGRSLARFCNAST